MAIYIIIEPAYSASSWCSNIVQGIFHQARQKRIDCFIQNENFVTQNTDLIALLGNSLSWICGTLGKIKASHSAHIVLVSNTPYPLSVNYICTDLQQTMLDIMSYLRNDCGKKEIAFYGVNPSSTTDILKQRGFYKSENVYYSDDDLRSCFEKFYTDIQKYDAVICSNDYAAISLIQNLRQCDPQQIQRLFFVSFANTHIAQEYEPSITSVALDYYEYGRNTVNLYQMLLKNPQISTLNINIKSSIIPRNTTQNIPYTGNSCNGLIPEQKSNVFFDDNEIRDLVTLENLFNTLDQTDEKIIKYLSDNYSYEMISQELFMSVNGIKYRLSKLLETCGINSRKELIQIYNKYFKPE